MTGAEPVDEELVAALLEGIKDFGEGRSRPAEEVIADVRERYGLISSRGQS